MFNYSKSLNVCQLLNEKQLLQLITKMLPKLITHSSKLITLSGVGLFAYMPFHIFLSQWISTFTGGLDGWKIGKDIFAALVTILCVVTVILSRKYTKLYLWLVGITAIYTLIHLILLITTNQPFDTGLLATVYNTRLLWYVLIGYSIVILQPKVVNAKKFVNLLLILSTIVCLIGLLQWLLPKDILTHFGYSIDRGVKPNFFIDDKPDLPRVFSTLRDPNSLGAFLILPITLLAHSLVEFWKTKKRMLLSGLLVLHSLILFLTFSRSALLGAVLSVAAVIALGYHKKLVTLTRRFAIPLTILFVVTLVGIFALRDQYIVQNVVFHSDENTQLADSNNLHVIQIQKGLDGIADQPLGNGPGTAGLVSVHNENGGLLTENFFVQIAYEVGVLGLLTFLGFLYVVIKKLWQTRKNHTAQILLASFVGLVLMNMLLHTWSNEAVATAWFLLAGATLNQTPYKISAKSKQ